MPSLKDLRNRIASVKATQKITKAMQMVAAAKLRRAQTAAEQARPYAARMEDVGPHFFEQRARTLQYRGFSAHHEGQCARNRAAGATRYGRIYKLHALGLGGIGHFA